MRQSLLLLWLGTSALGLTFLSGCKDVPEPCPCCQAEATAPAMTRSSYASSYSSNYTPQRPIVQVTGSQPVVQVAGLEATVIQEKVKEPQPEPGVITLTSGADPAPARRVYADITSSPTFSHAPDYTCLVGELQYLHVRNAWRVRYASVDEEDRYGGSVTLVEAGSMDKYPKSGQIVRVEGKLLNPDSREPSPAFRVNAIRLQNGQ